jgi:hypothetical protein
MPLTRTYVPEGVPFALTVATSAATLNLGVAGQRRRARIVRHRIQPTGWYHAVQLLDEQGRATGLEEFRTGEAGVLNDAHGWFIWDGEPHMSLEQIVRALARTEPLGGFDYEAGECALCHLGPGDRPEPEDPTEAHTTSCPWRQAVAWCREHYPE